MCISLRVAISADVSRRRIPLMRVRTRLSDAVGWFRAVTFFNLDRG
jgi:hypothetical protein